MSQQFLMMGNIEDEAVCYADGTVAHRMRRDGNPEFDLQELRTIIKCWNTHDPLTKQRDDLLTACEEIGKTILKLLDDADSERTSCQNSTDSDFYLAEGKFIGIEKVEAQIGKIINEAKSAIAAAK